MTEQPETDEQREQREDREETERDHAAGNHQYCGVTCEVEAPSDMLRNFILAKGYPGTAGALDELLRRAAVTPPSVADARVTELEAENARLRTAWTSARARVKRAKRNRDGELRWANNMWSDALNDLHRYRQAWKSARHRAAMYLQSNKNFSASLHNNHAAYLQLAAHAEKAEADLLEWKKLLQKSREMTAEHWAAIERVRELHQRWDADPASCAHCVDGFGTPLRYPCPTVRALDPQQTTTRCDYQATTGHEITCTAGFTDVCTCKSAGK